MDCLSYITIGSNDTKPVKSCCVGIESVIEYNPQCVCFGLASSSQLGFELNNTRALDMPKTCKLPVTPPHCPALSGASAPGASASTPSLSPVSPSATTPTSSQSSADSRATSPSSTTTMTAPSPASSGTNNLSVPTLILVAILISSIAYISALSN
ncbi:unnamed protein product [Arabis nemorensis]|uniref:Bifunctional inhibitor/plant lipid transfer protein/seed storage helical domain-containing protein n=1 Tax=Arabis nemorensis TaxID=586526 RepID=A0A565ARX5_9BRAS|nr:unnamed protein product [Arabis nemorensis]